MTGPQVTSGWVIVACDQPDRVETYIALGRPDVWYPAFRDVIDDVKVSKIRIPRNARVGQQKIYLRWGEHVEYVGHGLLRPVPAY